MKKVLYVILLLAELFIDVMALSLLYNNMGLAWCVGVAVFSIALVAWQIAVRKKLGSRKFKRNLALVLLAPVLVDFGVIIWFIVGLMSVI